MKAKYIQLLKESLHRHHVVDADIEDVLVDYEGLYDDSIDRGLTDEETWELLGDPDSVVKELMDTLRVRDFKVVRKRNNRLVALSPFLAVITYMLLGNLAGLWHPGWLVFLFIPIAGILGNVNKKEKFVALSPFIAIIVFIFLGTAYDAWHPGWLIFLIIPASGILTNVAKYGRWHGLLSFSALLAFILCGMYLDGWAWAWLFFLIIPFVESVKSSKPLSRYLLAPTLLLASAFYVWMLLVHDQPGYGLLAFILPLTIAIIIGKLQISISMDRSFKGMIQASMILVYLAAFIVIGLTVPGAWSWAWMILLFIPMTSIFIESKHLRLTPMMPFIAVIIFFSLGHFFELWYISWLAFLLIPMAGIIEGDGPVKITKHQNNSDD